MDRDRLDIVTPEGVTMSLDLAGVGSRGVAALIDFGTQIVILSAISLVAASATDGISAAIAVAAVFVTVFGYHVLFEVLNGGKTPGKAALSIRVVRSDGGPVRFAGSAIRSMLRIIDILPIGYVVGVIAIFSSARNQRIGDLAADTVIVHDAPQAPPPPLFGAAREEPERDLTGWDASLVTGEELAVLRQFLGRRFQIDGDSRRRLAVVIADRLDSRVSRPDAPMTAEAFLEHVATAKEWRNA